MTSESTLSQPSSSDHHPQHETRRKMDEEIAELEARLVALKLARNNHAPVARLHPEILQEIFSFAHDSDQHAGKTTLLITWVCHRWRELAHHTSSLWSYINFKHLDWVEASLSRTKNRELDFSIDEEIPGFLIEPLLTLLLENLSRIRTLKLIGDESTPLYEVYVTEEWMTPAPILSHLDLIGISLPPRVFGGIYPALQSIKLNQCKFDWETFLLPTGLKKLVIMNLTEQISVDKMLRLIRPMGRSLEQLSLRGALHLDLAPDVIPNKAFLENLRLLQVEEENPDITQLLSHLSLPRHTTIELCIPEAEGAEQELIPALIASRNIESQKWPIKCLEISSEHPHLIMRIVEDWSTSEYEDHNEHKKTHILLRMVIEHGMPLGPVLNVLPIHPIEKVSIYSYDHAVDTFEYLGNLGTIREIRIDMGSIGQFLNLMDNEVGKILREVGTEETLNDPLNLAAARSILSFENLRDVQVYATVDRKIFEADDISSLRAWLRWRKLSGFALQSLHLSGITVLSISWIQDLFSAVVGEFRMDDMVEHGSTH